MKLTNGLINSAKLLASSHCDNRPDNSEVSLLVIHCICLPPREFGHNFVEQLFLGQLDYSAHPYFEKLKKSRVSAHCYIKRDGELIQFVSFDRRAWHAGESEFNGIRNCNDFSIGIELEGCEDINYTDRQYQKLTLVTKLIQAEYPKITNNNITGHQNISPDRKSDPGQAFDWDKFYALISS